MMSLHINEPKVHNGKIEIIYFVVKARQNIYDIIIIKKYIEVERKIF